MNLGTGSVFDARLGELFDELRLLGDVCGFGLIDRLPRYRRTNGRRRGSG
jgi:hypothetical protein